MLKRYVYSTKHARLKGSALKCSRHQQGWIMLETLFSLVMFAVIMTMLHQQTQSHWQSLHQLEQEHLWRFQQTQIDALRLIKQEENWLLGNWSSVTSNNASGNMSGNTPRNCSTCQGDELDHWALSWLAKENESVTLLYFLAPASAR